MGRDDHRTDAAGNGLPESTFQPPVHLHLRVQEGLYALYGTPLPLHLCADILLDHLSERYLLLLALDYGQGHMPTYSSPAQWLRRQGLQAHSVPPSFAVIPVQQFPRLAPMPCSYLAFTDTPLPPDELTRVNVERFVVDTFAASDWHTLISPELDNRLYWDSRDARFTHLLCSERRLVAQVLWRFLRSYLHFHQPGVSPEEDFSPSIHEQLWHYAEQGLAPQDVKSTPFGVEMYVALGTPDRTACVLAQSCLHVTQIQRGFVLRWEHNRWNLCSTGDVHEAST
jgi:hypothetical protein